MKNDNEESGNEVELSLDDNNQSSSIETDFSNIESINLSNRKFSKPKKLDQKSFANSSQKKSATNSIEIRTDIKKKYLWLKDLEKTIIYFFK